MTKAKILIIEDDNDTQKFFNLFLGRKFEIEVFRSNTSCKEVVNNKNFDLLLLDISLKDGNTGLRLTKKIKSIKEFEKTPVICLSTHIFNTNEKNTYESYIDMFLTKPVRNEILLQSINTFIKCS